MCFKYFEFDCSTRYRKLTRRVYAEVGEFVFLKNLFVYGSLKFMDVVKFVFYPKASTKRANFWHVKRRMIQLSALFNFSLNRCNFWS